MERRERDIEPAEAVLPETTWAADSKRPVPAAAAGHTEHRPRQQAPGAPSCG